MGWTATDIFEAHMIPAFGKPAGYAAGGTQNIFFQGFTAGEGGNGTLYWLWWSPTDGDWSYGEEFTSGIGAPLLYQFTSLAGYYFAEQNTMHVFYAARDGSIIEVYRDDDGWHANNLSSNAGETIEVLDGPSAFLQNGVQHVIFRGADQHVHELFWDVAGWHPQDLTSRTGGPSAVGAPASYGFDAQSTGHVVFVASGVAPLGAGPVREFWRDSAGNWNDGGDLTVITGAPVPAVGVPAGYAFEGEFTQHVFYRGTDGNIHELRWAVATNGWHYWGKPTQLAGAPLATGDPAAYAFEEQYTEHVVYQAADGHIHELWRIAGGEWNHNDLTARTGAPSALSDPIIYPFDSFGFTQQVAYTSSDHHVVDLSWGPLASNPQFVQDVDGDGFADVVAFGTDGVWTALGKGDGTFDWEQLGAADFGYDAGGWRVEKHVRLVGDVTGDARQDVVGFGDAGVYVALATGGGAFGPTQFAVADLGYDQGWRVDRHPRVLADLRNKGRKDIIGFGDAGVYVALSNADGTFSYTPVPALFDFGYASGWRTDRHLRYVVDLTGQGTADIIGFFDDGVWVARGNGAGGFNPPQLVVSDFGYNAGGWRVDRHPRFLADLSGSGVLDIVGFGDAGVWVALGWGDGTFQEPKFVIADLGYDQGWRVAKHPRLLADVTGDGKADIVGFGNAGVYVAVSEGGGAFSYTPVPVIEDFGYEAGGWRVDNNPRFLARVAAAQRADIVGFGDVGVRTALATGAGGFGPTLLAAPDFGYWARPW